MSAFDRLAVYSNGYFARLLEILERDYSTVKAIVGDDEFRHLVAHYLEKHPSRHYNLIHLGKRFPKFLRTHRCTLADRDALVEALRDLHGLAGGKAEPVRRGLL